MDKDHPSFKQGALNLLAGCADAKPGESLAIIEEDPQEGYYGEGLAGALAAVAAEFGLVVSRHPVPFLPDADTLPPDLATVVAGHDHALFLARLGDQLRFKAMPASAHPIVSYALDQAAFASGFGTASYSAFVALKQAVNACLSNAREIRVTCPLGTEFSGAPPRPAAEQPADVLIKRFPMSVFAPVLAQGFTGRVAVAHLICGTGSRYYTPFGYPVREPLFVTVEAGRIARWEGSDREVQRVGAHYDAIGARYGIDPGFVHSWHAGIHPGCRYPGSAHQNYERWSGSAFGNPRLLHFHTCGAYAPGEICWNIVDPTIEVDGRRIWDHGRISLEAIPGAAGIVAEFPEIAALFASPEQQIGLDL